MKIKKMMEIEIDVNEKDQIECGACQFHGWIFDPDSWDKEYCHLFVDEAENLIELSNTERCPQCLDHFGMGEK